MPEDERKAIFGLMVGNEGKTRIPIYQNYMAAGFDPDKDMLQELSCLRTCIHLHPGGSPWVRGNGGTRHLTVASW